MVCRHSGSKSRGKERWSVIAVRVGNFVIPYKLGNAFIEAKLWISLLLIFHDPFLYFQPVLLEFELWKLQVPAKTQASGFCIELFAAFLSSVCLAGYFPTH